MTRRLPTPEPIAQALDAAGRSRARTSRHSIRHLPNWDFSATGLIQTQIASARFPFTPQSPSPPALLPIRGEKGARIRRRAEAPLSEHWAGHPMGGGWGEGRPRLV